MIVNEVYLRVIWEDGTTWLMDFKSHILRKDFLELYSGFFFEAMEKEGLSEIQLGGIESSAIPIIAAMSLFDTKGIIKNTFYIRKSRKKSWLSNSIEGEVLPNIPIILVDDIINRGTSLLKQLSVLGTPIAGIFVALRFRPLKYYKPFEVPVFSIFELDDLKGRLPVENIWDDNRPLISSLYEIETSKKISVVKDFTLVVAKSSPILVWEHIYIAGDDGKIVCIQTGDGMVLWSFQIPFWAGSKIILSTPKIYQDSIMFGGYDGTFYALDRFTGKVHWRYMEADWIGSSPCISTELWTVYVGLEFGLFRKRWGLVSIDIKTGKIIWKNHKASDGLIHASPAVSKRLGMVVCGSNDWIFRAFHIGTGELLWEYQTWGEIKHGAIFDEKRKLVMFGSLDGKFYVLHSQDGKEYASYDTGAWFYSTPVQKDNLVIIGSLDKHVYAYDIDKQTIVWKALTNGRIFSSPYIFESSCFIGSNDGMLYEFEVTSGKPLSLTQFPERILTQVQAEKIDGTRKIYLLTQDCVLYRLREKPKA